MKTSRPVPRRRAFTVTEMMMVVGLMTTISAAAYHVLWTSNRVTAETVSAQDTAARLDGVLERVREDVWSARRIETPDGRSLRLTDSAGRAVRWGFSPTVTRTVDAGPESENRTWNLSATPLSVESHGPLVTVRVTPTPGQPPDEITLLSQTRLLAGGDQ